MSSENRRHTRHSVQIGGEISLGFETVAVATQNVSEGGAALVVDVRVDRGATLAVTLFLTQDGIEDPDQEPFETQATIAWVRPYAGGRFLAGVGFLAVSAVQRDRLRSFLAAIP